MYEGRISKSYAGMTTIQMRNEVFKLKRSWPFDYCNYLNLS